jgi:hypothetical protein
VTGSNDTQDYLAMLVKVKGKVVPVLNYLSTTPLRRIGE